MRADSLLLIPGQGLVSINPESSQGPMETAGVSVSSSSIPVTRSQAIASNVQSSQQALPAQAAANPSAGTRDAPVRLSASGLAAPTGTPASALCDTSQSNLYCVYEVQSGDSLSTIAAKFSLPNGEVEAWQYLVHSNKPDIVSEDDILQIGQKIRVPVGGGVLHTVLSSQTLSDIAEQYDVEAADIMKVGINGISSPNSLTIGQEIIVPNPKQFAKPAPPPTPTPVPAPARAAAGSGSAASGSNSTGSNSSASSAGSAAAAPARGPASSAGFVWPTSGRISSYFGPSHPLGIDIDLFNNPNAAIGAAAAGTVTFAGGNACCSYGLYVVVSHGNGMSTLYAHLSKISVSVGEKVSQGALLGYGGHTGYATGNHLHFEVISGGAHVNPMGYLP
jgi:murein DD-endopeptidase MepM/ murein hydrolase activator NlpD